MIQQGKEAVSTLILIPILEIIEINFIFWIKLRLKIKFIKKKKLLSRHLILKWFEKQEIAIKLFLPNMKHVYIPIYIHLNH